MLFNYKYIKQFNDRDISAENRERNVRMICSLWVVWMLVPPIYIDILNGDSFQKAYFIYLLFNWSTFVFKRRT